MRLFNIILFVIYKILYDDIFHAKKKKEKKRNYFRTMKNFKTVFNSCFLVGR